MTASLQTPKPILIAGPCMAESFELLAEVAKHLVPLAKELGFDYYFKASFDKANRTAVDSYRGPGLKKASQWFARLRDEFGCKLLTDVHEVAQVQAASECCDALQIPAFLCRQTDLLVAAAATGRVVNIKKGQFMAPQAMAHVASKIRQACAAKGLAAQAFLTERGASFGYGDLVVDMRSFALLAKSGLPVIFDITHSTQSPPAQQGESISGAQRWCAPLLARSALASGYVSGFFMEVHPAPAQAKSDAAAQLNCQQAESLLRQLHAIWQTSRQWAALDSQFA